MATGWARDGAVQDQIDASVADAVEKARGRLPKGESLSHCEESFNHVFYVDPVNFPVSTGELGSPFM